MASKCSNCQSMIGCSCQLRRASDGRQVCSKCINQYEQSIKNSVLKKGNDPRIVNVTYNRIISN